MLEAYLVETCSIVTTIVDKFGSYLQTGTKNERCRFRDIATTRREAHAEVNGADAMLWLSPNTTAVKGSIILFDGEYYQIEKLTRAKRLGSGIVLFVKCDLKTIDISIS